MKKLAEFFRNHSPRQFAGYLVLALIVFAFTDSLFADHKYIFDGGGGLVNDKQRVTVSYNLNVYPSGNLRVSHTNLTMRCIGWVGQGQDPSYQALGAYIPWGGDSFVWTAQWVEDRYPIYYVSNFGQTYQTNTQYAVKSRRIKLDTNSFSRNGFRFLGWSRSPSAAKPDWQDGQDDVNLDEYRDLDDHVHTISSGNFTFDAWPVTLYAVWGKQFKIVFDPGDGSGEMEALILNEGEMSQLPKCNFTAPEGKKFFGWKSDSIGSYDDQGSIMYDSKVWQGNRATLIAEWTPIYYNLDFNPNGGTGTMESMRIRYGVSENLKPCEFSRKGYLFTGWATSATGEKVYSDRDSVRNLATHQDETVTLFAVWTPIYYAVRFDAAGGIGEMALMDCEYDKSYSLPANGFTREGGAFLGWTTNNANTVDFEDRASFSNLSSVANSTNVLRAVWSNIGYHIAFDGNGGEGSVATMDCDYSIVYQLPSNDFTRTGYVFTGWATNATTAAVYAEGASVSNLTLTADETIQLFAAWRPITYRVIFDANGGAGAMAPVTNVYDVPAALPVNTFTKLGRTFSGWATESTGSVVYADKASVLNLTAVDDGEFRLYAVWTKALSSLNTPLDNDELTILQDVDPCPHLSILETEDAVNGSCVKISRDNDGKTGFRIYLDTPGELTFRWKVVNVIDGWHYIGYTAKVYLEGVDMTNSVMSISREDEYPDPESVPEISWQDVKVAITNAPASLQFLFSNQSLTAYSDPYALFDHVRWSSGDNPEPTPEDAPVINGAAKVDGGKFRVTFAADKRFKYELIKTGSLSPVDWQSFSPQLFLTPDEDGNVSFEPDVEASELQMFYRVKVLKKD